MSVSLEARQQIQDLSGAIQQQPSNEVDGSYYNGELTLQMDAQTKAVKITWEKVKIGAKASKKWAVTGLGFGFLGGFAVGGLPAGAIFGLLGGVIGLSARTVVYICKVNKLESKVDKMRITAGKICDSVHDLEKKQRIQRVVTDAIRYLKNITLSDPDVVDQAYREKDNPNLLSEANQIVNETRDQTLNGAQAYILSSVVKKYVASWNGQMETIHRGIFNSLTQKKNRNQISIEEYGEKMREAIDWFRASLIK